MGHAIAHRRKGQGKALGREEVLSILRAELPRLSERYGVRKIFLYGSYARGQQKRKSDVDLLVDTQKQLSFEIVDIAEDLEEALGRKVHLATYDHFKRSLLDPRYRQIAEDIEKSMVNV